MPPYSIFWWIGFFHSPLLWFWKRRSIGHILAVLSPNWLKFWPKVGLASLLDCYSMKKSGYLLKKQSFRCFRSQPSLNWAGLAEWKFFCFFQHLSLRLEIFFDPCQPSPFFGGLAYFTRSYFGFEKEGKRPYLGRFKPDLAQILAKGRPG